MRIGGVWHLVLSDKMLQVGSRAQTLQLSCGVLHGFVLEPLLWNIYYDDILRAEMLEGITLVRYADDLAVVAITKNGT